MSRILSSRGVPALLVISALLSLAACSAHAQTSISGIINVASSIRTIRTEGCASFVQIDDTTGFASGDDVIVIQSMGCTDSTRYAVESVGLFERATIHAVDANGIVELERPLLHAYQECGRIQMVRIAMYTGTVLVQDTVRARAWNGSSGGVICMDVRGTLVVNAGFDAGGSGFPGGALWNGPGQCSTLIDNASLNHPDAAMKGGSFVVPPATSVAGGASFFTGGGGGVITVPATRLRTSVISARSEARRVVVHSTLMTAISEWGCTNTESGSALAELPLISSSVDTVQPAIA